jgi:hypothetical protein
MTDTPLVITGRAYGRRATLEIAGDTLTWRARRGDHDVAENIATTVHDIRAARWHNLGWSPGGVALVGLGAIWAASEGLAAGLGAMLAGLALVVWRRLQPRRYLVLDIGDRRLILQVSDASAGSARELAGRIHRALASGEPRSTPTLP